MGIYANPSWVRCFWQALLHYNIQLELDYPDMPMPRQGDTLLIDTLCLLVAQNLRKTHDIFFIPAIFQFAKPLQNSQILEARPARRQLAAHLHRPTPQRFILHDANQP